MSPHERSRSKVAATGRPRTLRTRLGKTRKCGPEGLRGWRRGLKMAFFLQKMVTFRLSTAQQPSVLMRIEVCWAFLQKKSFRTIFFARFFLIFVDFLPLPAAGRALQGPQPLLSRFRTCQKMSKNVKKISFFFIYFFASKWGPVASKWSKTVPKWSKSRNFCNRGPCRAALDRAGPPRPLPALESG